MYTSNKDLITYKCRQFTVQYQTMEAFRHNLDCEVMLETTANLFSYNTAAIARQKLADIAIMGGSR